ncbi:MAG TPA: hypothetical protein VMB22_02625 [Verrucomicrobiae bacterium]|nr:hypothetical protein [Verrucomicrobiae bacterium]
MRRLAQPDVLKKASIAALVTAAASYPRFVLWLNPSAPIWFLEVMIFLCSIVLWGFVFAWHEPYARRPVWTIKPDANSFIAATVVGVFIAVMFFLFVDPSLRRHAPDEFPSDLQHWFAFVLFDLLFNQLFLLFAPFAWLMRLFQNRRVATFLTVLLGVVVVNLKAQSYSTPMPWMLLAAILAGRIITGFLAVAFYLRGGVLLVWWWTLLFESRLLLDFAGHP